MNESEYNSKEFFEASERLAEAIKTSKTIIGIIEDPKYPAHRCLADYIIILLKDLNVDTNLVEKIENTFNSEFKRRDKESENKTD